MSIYQDFPSLTDGLCIFIHLFILFFLSFFWGEGEGVNSTAARSSDDGFFAESVVKRLLFYIRLLFRLFYRPIPSVFILCMERY